MSEKMSSSAQKVQEALKVHGVTCQVIEMQQTTRTARDAAEAVGCQVGQIAKSLVFMGKRSNLPILVIASGPNRVNEKTIRQHIGEPLCMAKAEFVREHTGFAIGGVPPTGHLNALKTYIDEDLLQFEEIWAAAGTPHAVFKLTPDELKRISGGEVISVK